MTQVLVKGVKLGLHIVDQNRLFAGPQWRFDRAGRIRGEVGYLNRITRQLGDDVMDHLVSINLLTTF